MFPKVSSALARALDPIQPTTRPGQALNTAKSSEGGEGGHGPLGYAGPDSGPTSGDGQSDSQKNPDDEDDESGKPKKLDTLPLGAEFTQLIIDLSAKRQEREAASVPNSAGVASSYGTSAKEQKQASRHPTGTRLDKKAA